MKKEIGGASPFVLETDFVQLSDGSLVEMIEDPCDATKTKFAIFRNGAVQYADRLSEGKKTLVPLPRAELHLKHVCLPRGAEPFGGFMDLLGDVGAFFKFCLDVDDRSLLLMMAHVLSTWFPEKLPFAPYLALVGPPGSGKTTALRVLGMLCRRSLLTADITSAAFYDVCDRIHPTILIDEALTAGNPRTLSHLLRATSSRGFVSLRKGNAQLAHGPKVLSWVELPNDPQLCSRCIIVPMHRTTRTDLNGPDETHVLKFAEKVRMRLLQFRFDRFSDLSVSRIPPAPGLSSRPLDLYRGLAIAAADEPEFCEALASLISDQRRFQVQLLSPAQTSALRVLYEFIHENPNGGGARVQDLAAAVNRDLASRGESSALSERKLGIVLTSLGLTNRTRLNTGYVLWLDRSAQQLIHKMVRDYEVCSESERSSNTTCEICREGNQAATQVGSKKAPAGDKPAAAEAKSERSERRERQVEVPGMSDGVCRKHEPRTAKSSRHARSQCDSSSAAVGPRLTRRGTPPRNGESSLREASAAQVRAPGKAQAAKWTEFQRIKRASSKP